MHKELKACTRSICNTVTTFVSHILAAHMYIYNSKFFQKYLDTLQFWWITTTSNHIVYPLNCSAEQLWDKKWGSKLNGSMQLSRGYVYLPRTLYFCGGFYLALNKSQYWKSMWKHAHGSYALKSKDPDNHLNLWWKIRMTSQTKNHSLNLILW